MLETEKLKLIVGFMKWVEGEPLGYHDLKRVINFITLNPPQISSPSPDEVAQLRSDANIQWQKTYMQQ